MCTHGKPPHAALPALGEHSSGRGMRSVLAREQTPQSGGWPSHAERRVRAAFCAVCTRVSRLPASLIRSIASSQMYLTLCVCVH